MRKPALCICENKDADQLRSNREADQRLCFCYMDSTIPLLSVGNPRDNLVRNTDFSVYFPSIQGRTFLNISRYT